MRVIEQSVKLLSPVTKSDINEGLFAIEAAARNCYDSSHLIGDKPNERFISNLIDRGHDSPLEFMNFRFEIVTSRDVMAELTRHRIGVSFAIKSQRYVKDNKHGGIDFIRPEFSTTYTPPNHYERLSTWRDHMLNAEAAYNKMLELGATPEDARKVLPNSVATKIYMSVNVRELRHILELRASKAAYPEMRKLASLLLESVAHVPTLFCDLQLLL